MNTSKIFLSGLLSTSLTIFWAGSAQAILTGSGLLSLGAYSLCDQLVGRFFLCLGFAIVVDPDPVDEISFSLEYDSSLFSFNPSRSGPLCDFAIGGDCPTDSFSIGTFPIENLAINPGSPLPGSDIIINTDENIVNLSYSLPSEVSIDESQNFFTLFFDLKTPIEVSDPSLLQATYSDSETGMFTQLDATCSPGSCQGNPPVLSVTIENTETVPESSFTPGLLALGTLGAGSSFLRQKKQNKVD